MGEMQSGWHNNGDGRQRWHDGTDWTDHYRPSAPPPAGHDYHPAMDKATGQTTGAQATRNAWLGWLGCLGVIAFVIIAIVGTVNNLNKNDSGDMNSEYEAKAQCESRIETMLKAPSTAKFSSTASGYGTWTVTGTVDAENGFGAMIRSSYRCTVVMNNETRTATTTVDYFD